jgi:adenylate cyclase
MADLTPAYAREFGVAPQFRAGVHTRPVVVSECGDAKRQIAYFGDTMNVAARLCDHCKATEEAVLVSADLLRAAAVPPELAVGTRASMMLRGRKPILNSPRFWEQVGCRRRGLRLFLQPRHRPRSKYEI